MIVGNAGVLLSKVIRVKQGAQAPFVIVDAAMNDLMRPSLYDAWHDIRAVAPDGNRIASNVVGPVCETGDTFAMGRDMD
ncbi:diaminopimelate decarboxylase, partial [Pseudoalteromonas sp. NZS100_1]|nr:diaminopimelate decarboxylase [Pseudoalteromonas sp. NZS100_1]